MLHKFNQLFIACVLLMTVLSSCEDVTDMAMDRVAAPVLGVFESSYSADSTMLQVEATFYELNKDGILDQTVGIDSIPVAGLPIGVYINETTQLSNLETDADGKVYFEGDLSVLSGVGTLEWAGSYNNTAFRIRQGL